MKAIALDPDLERIAINDRGAAVGWDGQAGWERQGGRARTLFGRSIMPLRDRHIGLLPNGPAPASGHRQLLSAAISREKRNSFRFRIMIFRFYA